MISISGIGLATVGSLSAAILISKVSQPSSPLSSVAQIVTSNGSAVVESGQPANVLVAGSNVTQCEPILSISVFVES